MGNLNRLLRAVCVASWVGVAGWAATVWVLSSLSGPEVGALVPFQLSDKLLHFAAFFVGGALLAAALTLSTPWPPTRIWLLALLGVALFGAVDEYHQKFTPQRTGSDFGDWLADALGGAAGAYSLVTLHARNTQRHRPPAPART